MTFLAASEQQERTTLDNPQAQAQRDAVVAHSSDLVIYFDADGTIAWASPATRTLFGMAPESIVGRNGMDLIHPDDRERAIGELMSIPGLGDHVQTEFRVLDEDGTVHWIEETATNLIDDPQVGYVVANLNNITARKRQEEDIRLRNRLLDAAGLAIVAVDMDGVILYWNAAATNTFGWTEDEARGKPLLEILAPGSGWAEEAAAVAEHVVSGKQWTGDFLVRRKDGSEIPIFVTDTPVYDDAGDQIGFIAVSSDITERKRHEHVLAELSAIVTYSADAIFSTNLDGIVQTWNHAAEVLYGYTAADMIGRDIGITLPPDYDESRMRQIATLTSGKSIAAVDTTRRRADGTFIDAAISVSPILDRDEKVIGASAIVRDITERKRLEFALWHQANHDTLTGLANRTMLIEQLDALLAPTDADLLVGVLLFDVDRFKLINDSLGHDRGDQLLVAIAERLRETLGPDDIAARFGSDAFAIVAPAIETPEQARELAERIRTRLADGLRVGADRHLPTISVGIVIARPGDSALTALRDAETAMYRAKERGRDRAEWFDPALHRDVVASFEVERDLRRAIYHDELYLDFQPVTDIETGEICSCEALVRWHHPTRGTLSPDDFIPVAEKTSLIVSVGRWVLESALTTAAAWPDAVQIAVNLSPRELAEPDLVAFVKTTLDAVGMNASRLVFEITETAVVEDPTGAARAISALRALGVSVVIDDFGTGYTSLSFLRDYQLDGLKIDRSYVTDLENGSTAIVDAMIRMSAALGLQVIAEGIETPAELAQLQALGCRFLQGFLLGRPVAPEDLAFMQDR